MRYLLLATLLTVSSSLVTADDTTLTRTSIGGGIAAGINQHATNFRQLTSFPACCPEYTSGSGFHLGYWLHLAYQPESNLFGLPYSYGVRLSGVAFSGMLTDDEEIGMVINGQNVTRGMARHTIDATFTTVGVEPYLQLQSIAGTPLSVTAGLFGGFPVAATFDQKEELIEPTDPSYTFETGSRSRGITNGDIPSPASPLLAAVIGVGYMHELDAQRAIEPRIETLIGLTDLTSAVSWGVTSFRVGVNFHYRIPKPVIAPPPPPPPPTPVEPPVRVPVLSSKLMVPQMTPSQLSGVRNVAVTREYVDAAPVMFFAKNSTEVVGTTKTQSQLQQVVASAITEYMKQHPEAKLTLVGSAAYDEDQAVARERVSYVTRLLGLPTEQLERRLVKLPAPEYPELAEEHRSVQFLVNGAPQIFRVERTKDSIETITPLRIPVGHLVSCDTTCTSSLSASIAGRMLRVEGDAPTYTVVIDSTALQLMKEGEYAVIRGQVAFEATTAGSQEQVAYTNIEPRVTVRLLPAGQTSNNVSSTLCYFDFNGATITSFNERAFAVIQESVASGKRVEIIATTDHLGTAASNAALAERRAAAAIERLVALGIAKDRIIAGTYTTVAAENGSPMERIANRSVKIIIRD